MKLKVQAQHLQIGDIVGSGEEVIDIIRNSVSFPSSKVAIMLYKGDKRRTAYWGKYTEINVERPPTDITDIKPIEKQSIKPHGRRFGL